MINSAMSCSGEHVGDDMESYLVSIFVDRRATIRIQYRRFAGFTVRLNVDALLEKKKLKSYMDSGNAFYTIRYPTIPITMTSEI